MLRRLRALFHPIIVFIGVQIAWIILMGVGINWYIKKNLEFQEFARRFRPDLFTSDINWVILLEGCFLMLIILAGVYLIFVFWNKQAKLNRLQSNFVSSVSHELKSPLASIQLYLETLKYQKVSTQEKHEFVEMMLADTERLSGLIENILESSKSDPKSMQLNFLPIEIGPFLEEMMNSFQGRFKERKCATKLEIFDSPTLNIDKRMMGMVINNLINNALRYSSVGSGLKVCVKNNGKFCNIQIIDSGMGIDKSDLKKIFRKFYRIQNRDTKNIAGAGLGLFISHEIVKNHKGKLIVDSFGKGRGSTFTVALPLATGI